MPEPEDKDKPESPVERIAERVGEAIGTATGKAKKAVRYDRASPAGPAAALAASDEETEAAERPWSPPLDAGAAPEEERPRAAARERKGPPRGGASDMHRR